MIKTKNKVKGSIKSILIVMLVIFSVFGAPYILYSNLKTTVTKNDDNWKPVKHSYDVILYSNDGTVLKKYQASSYTSGNKNGACIITYPGGKKIQISGTFVIEEVK